MITVDVSKLTPELIALCVLPVGTRVRIIGRPEFGVGTITTVLDHNRYGVTCPDSRMACPVSTDGIRRDDRGGQYYPLLAVVPAPEFTVTLYAKGGNVAAPAVLAAFDTIDAARACVAAEMAKSADGTVWTRDERFGAESIECAHFGFQIDTVQS